MNNCPIPGARGWQEPTGSCSNGVMLLSEAMGDSEADESRGFVESAPAGSVLERAIKRSGFNREQFVVWNVVPVQPPHNHLEGAKYEGEAIAWGLQYVRDVIEKYRPSVVLALGNIALKATTGLSGILENRGYPCSSNALGIPVISTLHPAFLRRGAMSYLSVLMHDLRFAVAYAAALRNDAKEGRLLGSASGGRASQPGSDSRPIDLAGFTQRPAPEPSNGLHSSVTFWSPVLWREVTYEIPQPLPSLFDAVAPYGYHCHPTEADAEDFFAACEVNPNTMLAYDIETPYVKGEENDPESNEIRSIQFSLAPETGIFMPWRAPFDAIARRILALRNPKIGANNWRFDRPILQANGCTINGTDYDLRWMWKAFQPDLSGGLSFINSFYNPGLGTWKHLDRSAPQVYGIRDCDVLQCII